MKHLSTTKAASIVRLAAASHDEYRQRHPGNRILGAGELKALILEPDSQEEIAFVEAMRALSDDELLDLVALMCVGRGEHVENPEDPESIRDAFEGHARSFSKDSHKELLDYISDKGAVIHRYLARGLDRVRFAYK